MQNLIPCLFTVEMLYINIKKIGEESFCLRIRRRNISISGKAKPVPDIFHERLREPLGVFLFSGFGEINCQYFLF